MFVTQNYNLEVIASFFTLKIFSLSVQCMGTVDPIQGGRFFNLFGAWDDQICPYLELVNFHHDMDFRTNRGKIRFPATFVFIVTGEGRSDLTTYGN